MNIPGKIKILLLLVMMFFGLALRFSMPAKTLAFAQQPTGSIPTVTGTPAGAIVALYLDETRPQENVYSGPSSYLYPKVGIILAGQEVPAYGYSEDEQWIQIYYPGVPDSVAWVYAPYVKIVKFGQLPLVAAPPTPTLISTPTSNIDPTLEAAFNTPVISTRLPTFTPPPPLVAPVFSSDQSNVNRVPMGLLILGLSFVGGLGALISFLRGR